MAGFFYMLLLPIAAIQSAFGRVGLTNDVAQAAANIIGHPTAIHIGFACDLLVTISYLVVTALLYELFIPVSRTLSRIAAYFGVAGCVIQSCAALFRIAPLTVLLAGQSAIGSKKDQVDTLAYLLFKLYAPAYSIALVFFAVFGVVIGYLAYKSTFLPRLIGGLMMLSGFGWLTFLWPPLAMLLWPKVQMALAALGEGSLMLWLLIAGVKEERWIERAREAQSGL